MQDDAQGRSSKIQPLEPAFSSGKTSTEQLWVSNPPVIFGVTEFMTYKTPELHRMFAIPDMFSRFPQWKLWPIMARDGHRPHAPCSQNLARPWRLSSACHSQWWHPKVSQSFELSLNWEAHKYRKSIINHHVQHIVAGFKPFMGVSISGGSPIAGWFMMNNRKLLLKYIKMDDLGIPPFQETSIGKISQPRAAQTAKTGLRAWRGPGRFADPLLKIH